MPDVVDVLVDAGAATPGPPLGPALGPLGVNIVNIAKDINAKTEAFTGMKVPVKITIKDDKSYTIEVGTPPVSALIKDELKIEAGAHKAKYETVGNLTVEQLVKVAKMKADSLLGATLKARAMEVAGACVSMGVSIHGKPAKDVQKLIKEGAYNAALGA
jgi:large subunit ribosomal protein L11